MAALERKYIVPLRREWQKVPSYKRTRKSITALREFLQKHMKVDDVKIGFYLNKKMCARGPKKPLHKVEVLATKIEEKDHTYVTAELPDAPKIEVKEAPKKAGKITDKLKDVLKAPEDKAKKADEEKEKKLLKKETEHKAETTKTPAPETKAEPKGDKKENIVKHTGKSKEGVETTGQK